MERIDLHAHTTASDGSYTPTELVRYAKQKGLLAVAITDHDTVSGVHEALKEGRATGVQVIPGVELSTRVDGCDVHLIALFIDYKNPRLLQRLDAMAKCRANRNFKMVDKLHEAGFQIDRSDLDQFGKEKLLARAHIAQILIARGYASELKEALNKYLVKGTVGYVPKDVLSPEECISLVHSAGGLVFVAHLHQIDPKDSFHCIKICKKIIESGADGLETQYSEFDDNWRTISENIANEYGCLRSGGSDFHGTIKKGLDLANGYGNLVVPYSFLEEMNKTLKTRANNN